MCVRVCILGVYVLGVFVIVLYACVSGLYLCVLCLHFGVYLRVGFLSVGVKFGLCVSVCVVTSCCCCVCIVVCTCLCIDCLCVCVF